MKHENNKYYTPEWLIEKMIDKIKENIKDEITEIIEPSAGDGRFLPHLKELSPNVLMYDIEPDNESVIKQDFFELDTPYKKGRIVVGNPPFGVGGNLYKKFIIKSTQIADYIVFILPSSQINRNYYFKNRCSLIYSELLNDVEYDTIEGKHSVKTCLNIYSTKDNDMEKYNFSFIDDDILFYSFSKYRDKKRIQNTKVDFYINGWGFNQGKLFKTNDKSLMIGILIKNENLRSRFNDFFETFYERYNDEIKQISPGVSYTIVTKTFIQEKLKKDFYKK